MTPTMTVLVLSESDRLKMPDWQDSKVDTLESKPGHDLKHENMAGGNIGVLKALTHLVNTVTYELVNANEKLKYVSLHDVLTGLNNRICFEQEMKNYEDYSGTVGIIVCDIDCLKLINDLLGHRIGDRVICMAADCLTQSCRPQDTIARIGGDEFVVLVPDADEHLLTEICNRIIKTASSNSYLGSRKILHLTTGFALKGLDGAKTMVEAFITADFNMYRSKSAEADNIQKIIVNNINNTFPE